MYKRMKEGLFRYSTLSLSKKNSLVLALTLTMVFVFDSTIVDFSSYSGMSPPIWLNTTIFAIFFLLFVTTSALLLNSARIVISKYAYDSAPLGFDYSHWVIGGIQILTALTILTILFQMLIFDKYSLALLNFQTYLSHVSAAIFLSLLVILFIGWIKSRKNYVILIYIIAFSLSTVNLIVSLLYLESYFSFSALPDVVPHSITAYVINLPGSPLTEFLSATFDALSVVSFLLMWIATAVFLSHYRFKMGRMKYFSLMSIPLIYYVFPFEGYFGDVFLPLLQSSPVSYSIMYLLIFSATKQVGALLFSLVFWTASDLVHDDRIKKSLLLSSIGMVVLFGSFEISPLQYHVYPPYGLMTETFIPLGTYLLLVGIYASARHISRDAELRKEFYKSASNQLKLLKTIGVSQMERELEKQVKYVEKRSGVSEKETEFHKREKLLLNDEENVKQILRDVLNELYDSKVKGKTESTTE
jgi:hypothetical protein